MIKIIFLLVIFCILKTHALCRTDYDSKSMMQIDEGIKESSPFRYACQDTELLKGRPKTGLFARKVPEADQNKNKSVDLLNKIKDKVLKKIEQNKNMISNLKSCLISNDPKCTELKTWSTESLPKYVKDARFHLSVSQSHHQMKTILGRSSDKPNSELEPLGSPKMKDWDKLTTQEELAAKNALNIYKKQISTEFPKESNDQQSETLMGYRYSHFEIYQSMIAELPLLQYIHSESPNQEEILEAINNLEKNLKTEEQTIEDLIPVLYKNPISPKVLSLMNYNSFVEEILLQEPKYCGLATSLLYTQDNRYLGNALAIGLPILALSFVAPPLAIAVGSTAFVGTGVAVGVGVVAGSAFAYQSHLDLKDERVKAFSHVYGETDAAGNVDATELERVRMAEKARNFQIVTVPLAFGGLGAFKSVALRVGSTASRAKLLFRSDLSRK